MQIKDLIPWNRDKHEVATSHDNDNPVSTLQRDINRMFDDFWGRFGKPFGGAGMFGPSTDISETDEAVEVSVELPGLDEKDIEVTLSGDTLTIRGEKKAERNHEAKGHYLSERTYGSFFRSVPLPPGVDTEKAEAEFKRGVLTVNLPRTEEALAQVKKINVKAA